MSIPRFFQPRRQAAWTYLGAIAALIADQGTKVYAEARHLLAPPIPNMAYHRATSELVLSLGAVPTHAMPPPDAGSFLAVEITHVANAGVVLGALEQAPSPIPLLVFMVTTAAALSLGGWLVWIASPSRTWLRLGASLVVVGAAGNLIDRVRLGYVIDWLYLRWKLFGWAVDAPTFNLADLLILGGAALGIGALLGARVGAHRTG